MSYSTPIDQRSMALDTHRNKFYRDALSKVITSESVVLDLGAGTGILGLMAARLGAKRVYFVEPATNVEVIRRLAVENQVEDRIQLIQKTIQQTELPEKVDVILSVFTGNFLVEEDLLPSLFFARDKFLKEDGVLIPDRASMIAAPIDATPYYQRHIGCWSKPQHGVRHTSMQSHAVNSLYYDHFNQLKHTLLSEPATLATMDFYDCTNASVDTVINYTMTVEGYFTGMLGWFDTKLGDQWLSTGPGAKATHWSQVLLPTENPIALSKGNDVKFSLKRPEYGEWNWSYETKGMITNHSTFLAQPFSVNDLRARSPEHTPTLAAQGRLLESLLSKLNGTKTGKEIATELFSEFPDQFSDQLEAEHYCLDQISKLGQ